MLSFKKWKSSLDAELKRQCGITSSDIGLSDDELSAVFEDGGDWLEYASFLIDKYELCAVDD